MSRIQKAKTVPSSADAVRRISRRRFLGQASCAAVGSTAFFSTLLNLRMASRAAAQITPGEDYKALVCVFLMGGNDSFNMLVPRGDAEYAQYVAARGDLALPQEDLLALNPTTAGGVQLGLNPAMPEVQNLFNTGRAAFISNVGTLIEPTTKSAYFAQAASLPRGLYSHSDQIQQWQTSVLDSGAALGWAGRTADLLHSLNDTDAVSMNISLGGVNVWQSGLTAFPYSISSGGASGLTGYDGRYGLNGIRGAAIDNLAGQEYQNLFNRTFAHLNERAFASREDFAAALESGGNFQTVFPNTGLGDDLEQVLRTVSARGALGARRQTFFVGVGGWDHHDEVIANQRTMLAMVSQALGAFQAGLEEIGMADKVTLFTASDFGRTLSSNGRGSDHAWGGNHIVIGGAVKGQTIYGQYPDLAPDGALDVGRGRIIPTTSCDEYFAELALWLGVSPSELDTVLPNIGRFYTPGSGSAPLGFLLS